MTETNEKTYCWTCKRWIAPVWWERHMASLRHLRCVLEGPPAFSGSTRETRQCAGPLDDGDEPDEPDEPDEADNPDTRAQCGGCSRRITPGSEYHHDDGKAYHNNCVPLNTTRPLNRPQTAQVARRQAGKLVAGVVVQLGTGEPQNA